MYKGANFSLRCNHASVLNLGVIMTINVKKARHPLKRAVSRQMGGAEHLYEVASDVANYGANAGWSGFIYCKDTIHFTKRNKAKIIDCLKEDAFSCGESFANFVSGFGCFKGMAQDEIMDGLYNPKSIHLTTVYNGLAWYALESVCYAIVNECEL